MSICIIIPASGKGIRYGCPKADALLESGLSFSQAIISTCHAAGLNEIELIREADCLEMLAGIRLGIERRPGYRHYLIFPVDHPFVLPQSLVTICSTASIHPGKIIRPCYLGKPGHPILIPYSLNLNVDSPCGLAGIIRESGMTIIDIPVDDPGILRNLNHPGD
jgi:CTP:molybdopterin cytidylyltransferase MocA